MSFRRLLKGVAFAILFVDLPFLLFFVRFYFQYLLGPNAEHQWVEDGDAFKTIVALSIWILGCAIMLIDSVISSSKEGPNKFRLFGWEVVNIVGAGIGIVLVALLG